VAARRLLFGNQGSAIAPAPARAVLRNALLSRVFIVDYLFQL